MQRNNNLVKGDLKGRIGRTMILKGLTEGILPTFIKLRAFFHERKNPLENDVIETLAIMIKEFKPEIDLLISSKCSIAHGLIQEKKKTLKKKKKKKKKKS